MTQKAKGVDYLHSLSHTRWNCRYHIVFVPKCRRKVFYEGRRLEIDDARQAFPAKPFQSIPDRGCPA